MNAVALKPATPVLGSFAETFAGSGIHAPGRLQAFARFAEQGLPNPRHEAWKYTNVTALAKVAYRAALRGAVVADLPAIADLPATRIVIVDGFYRADLSDAPPKEMVIDPLAGEISEVVQTPFTALNAAFAEGVQITVHAGAQLSTPVHLLVLASGSNVADTISAPRVHIRLGASASAMFLEHQLSLSASGCLILAHTTFELAGAAQATHILMTEAGEKSTHIGAVGVRQARDSRMTQFSLALSGKLIRQDIVAALTEPGAQVVLNGVYAPNGREHVDHHTRIDHSAPHTTSRENYKGVLSDHSRAVFNGKVKVHPGADKTDAEQSNKNLLLSVNAEVDTKPELEIYADDVKCAHGATVGQLDAQALFYLRSRGIGELQARALLTQAFFGEIVESLPLPALRSYLAEKLSARLHLPEISA